MLEPAQKEENGMMEKCIEISDGQTSQDCVIEADESSSNIVLLNQHNAKEIKGIPCVYSRKVSKELRNKGAAYITAKGDIRPAKQFKPLSGDCRRECKKKVPLKVQLRYFDTYWTLGTYNRRILFIGAHMNLVEKKTRSLIKHSEKPRDRRHNVQYSLEVKGKPVQVCQKCFVKVFDESEGFVKGVQKKLYEYPMHEFRDHRGTALNKISTKDSRNQISKSDNNNQISANDDNNQISANDDNNQVSKNVIDQIFINDNNQILTNDNDLISTNVNNQTPANINKNKNCVSNKIPTSVISIIKDHIKSFPHYEIKFSESNTSCKVFPADQTINEMYRLYYEQYKAGAVSLAFYSQIFKTMNIKFQQDLEQNDVLIKDETQKMQF